MVVSAAAGATGSIAGQLGKIHGCRVVGIAGSEEKCKWVKELGFDEAINYKVPGWQEKLREAPKGVGGEVMQAALDRMNLHGRVVLCGLISGYTRQDPGLASVSPGCGLPTSRRPKYAVTPLIPSVPRKFASLKKGIEGVF